MILRGHCLDVSVPNLSKILKLPANTSALKNVVKSPPCDCGVKLEEILSEAILKIPRETCVHSIVVVTFDINY